jgi:DNA-binding transcriptional regulator/RsmH inhibitor MraZ
VETPANQIPARNLVRVDEQRRVDLKRSLVELTLGVVLEPGATVNVWALTGSHGQLQLLPPKCDLARFRDEFDTATEDSIVPWDASADQRIATTRRLAGFFRVTCHRRETGQLMRITFPADAVDFGIIPTKESIVIFARGQILEFWSRERWQMANSIPDLRAFTRDVRQTHEDESPYP